MEEEVLEFCKEHLNKEHIIAEAKKNGERPFGYVIDFIKDEFNISKTQAWYTAEKVIIYFGLTNNECGV